MKRLKASDTTHMKVLMYGQPGSTKTRTAATAALDPRTAPVLHLDIGGNTLSIRDYEYQPDILRIDKFAECNMVYDFLVGGMQKTHRLVNEQGLRTDYKTVIIDGITDLQRDAFQDETGNRGKGPGDRLLPRQIQHYGAVMAQMTYFAQLFYKLPMHVIVTALEKEEINATTGSIYYKPMLDGQAAGMVLSYAYTVMRMLPIGRMTKKMREALEKAGYVFGPTDSSIGVLRAGLEHAAKDQSGIGMQYMIGPSMTKMLDAIEVNSANPKPYPVDDSGLLDIMAFTEAVGELGQEG